MDVAVFVEHFWRCYDCLSSTDVGDFTLEDKPGMPAYFRFLALLGVCKGPRLESRSSGRMHFIFVRISMHSNQVLSVPFFVFSFIAGLQIFLAEKVDVVILEVGMGGRLDATNCVDHPSVCGITSLGMDHMEVLGDTLAVSRAEMWDGRGEGPSPFAKRSTVATGTLRCGYIFRVVCLGRER